MLQIFLLKASTNASHFFNLALHFDKEYSSRQKWKPPQFSDERKLSTMILFLIYSLPNREKRVGRQNSSTNPEASVHIFKSFIPVTLFLFFFFSFQYPFIYEYVSSPFFFAFYFPRCMVYCIEELLGCVAEMTAARPKLSYQYRSTVRV